MSPKTEQLRRPAAEQHRHLVLAVPSRVIRIAVLGRPLDRVAERADAARNDRHLVHRVGARQRHRDQRVAHLVIGDDLALLRIEQAVLLLEPGDDALDRVGEVRPSSPRRRLRRVATSAASLTRLARSAPVKPGVSAAICSGSTSRASLTLLQMDVRICDAARACRADRPAPGGRSGRRAAGPGRGSPAGWSPPGAPAPLRGSKPSSSTSSWLSVCSFSSWPPPRRRRRRARGRARRARR